MQNLYILISLNRIYITNTVLKMERPFREVINSARENLDKAEENDKFNQNFLDSFSLWLIGLEVAGFSLAIVNTDKIVPWSGIVSTKIMLMLFLVAIIGGILHRYFLFLFRKEYNENLFFLRGALSNKKVMTVEPEDVTDIQELDKIILYLQEDFGLDYNEYLKLELSESDKLLLLEDLKQKYVNFGEWAKRDYQLGLEYLKDTFSHVYKYSEKQYLKMNNTDGQVAKKLDMIQVRLLLVSIMSFISALILLAIKI